MKTEMEMTINKTIQEDTMTLKIEGWLDTQTAPELGEALRELPENIKSLTIDMEKLEYISSAGIRQLVAAYKQMSGNMTIANVSEEIMNIFKMTGLDKKMNFQVNPSE